MFIAKHWKFGPGKVRQTLPYSGIRGMSKGYKETNLLYGGKNNTHLSIPTEKFVGVYYTKEVEVKVEVCIMH